MNLYTYCFNNPINGWDPTGHKVKWYQWGVIAAGVESRTIKDAVGNFTGETERGIAEFVISIAKGEVTVDSLKQMGIDVTVGEIKYVIDHSYMITDNNSYSNLEMLVFGEHVAGAGTQIVTAGTVLYGAAKGVKSLASDIRNLSKGTVKNIGKAFDPKGRRIQEGVDPNTLKPGKKLENIDPQEIKNAVKYAGDKPIIVDRNGNVLDGHHRLAYAIKNGRSVDVQIGYN